MHTLDHDRCYRALAALDAGLGACRRCQPEAVPRNPEWNLRDDLVGRAMRLIIDGVVERKGVTGLATSHSTFAAGVTPFWARMRGRPLTQATAPW